MQKRAFIFDFDNTIFPVTSIGFTLFKPLFELIEAEGNHADEMDDIKDEVMWRPFQEVAKKHGFSKELTEKGIDLLNTLTYDGNIDPYDDYPFVKELQGLRFLVTTGFTKLQNSKIEASNTIGDFTEVFVVDPEKSDKTKKDIFLEIMKKHGLAAEEILVIGDDPDSEIKFGAQLGIDTVLYDKEGRNPGAEATYTIHNFQELQRIVSLT